MSGKPSKKRRRVTKNAALINSGGQALDEFEKAQLLDSLKDISDGGNSKPKRKPEVTGQISKVHTQVIEQNFSGPIPPPNIIAGYEEAVPGAADRIIRMAERQSAHRQKLELLTAQTESRDSLLGVLFAFLLGSGCLAACVVMVIAVPGAAGVISGSFVGITGIGAIVGAFLKNTRKSNK